MTNLDRSSLKKLIIKEMQKIIDEETILNKDDYKNYGMISKHDDPGRELYTNCFDCGIKVYESESVCSQCGAENKDLNESNCGPDIKVGNHKNYKGSYMAKSHLYKVNKYAEKLYHMIPDGHNLEDWMRSKIAQIADDISEVYHALDHDRYEGDV